VSHVATKMRRVALLGAFEIAPELDPPVKDGIILGSRRDHRGFVLETSRENIEQIVSASVPPDELPVPVRLPLAVGPMIERLGGELVRVELRPTAMNGDDPNGAFVQGSLLFRPRGGRLTRLAMTATEALQVAISQRLPILADARLLQLDVSQFLSEIDAVSQEAQVDAQEFKHFVDNVTASDFSQYLRKREQEPPEEQQG